MDGWMDRQAGIVYKMNMQYNNDTHIRRKGERKKKDHEGYG